MDDGRSEEQILRELEELRLRVAELENFEADRKRVEEEAVQGEAYFRALVENSYDAVVVLEKDGTLRYASPPVSRVSGYEPEELEGENPIKFIHQDDVPEIVKIYSEGARKPGFTERVEFRFRFKDGSWHILEGVGMNLLDQPPVSGVVINFREITEFKRMEKELRESEERYRYLLENLNDVVFTIDTQGVLTYISPAIERISGYEVEEVKGRSFTDFIYPEDLPGLMESLERTIAGRLEPYEFRILDKGGEISNVRTSSRPLLEDGEPVGLIGIMTEITESKKADEALRRSGEDFRALIRERIRYSRGHE